ncbi:MAG TPA: MOSC domain-containing protein [Acidimicrobiales bacterium]|nr:MOSC domain-containing protein [Acidimicrobiales bacterium]
MTPPGATTGASDRTRRAERATVVGVYVGRPAVIGADRRGAPVTSAIAKGPVAGTTIAVGELNLAGDAQADLSVHGGPDKAVYAYPAGHYAAWRAAGFDLAPGGVGENLALDGVTEDDVRIGDVWRWGDAVLQVSQPRSPCFKLAIHVGRRGAGAEMVRSGHCGWYLRVLTPGDAPTAGDLVREASDPDQPTVAEAFAAAIGRAGPAVVARVAASPALAPQWRAGVVR